jgi:YaiO family outer membrane protein
MRRARVTNLLGTGRVRWSLCLLAATLSPVLSAAAPGCAATTAAADVEVEATPVPAQRFRCARLLAERGDYQAAIREYEALSARYPDNVDYLFGEAQVRFWSGDKAGALHLLPRARQLAPGYEDLWRLEYQVLSSLEDRDAKERTHAFRIAALQRFPGASWLQGVQASGSATVHWEFGLDVDSLDNGAADWQHVYAHVDRRSRNDAVISLTVSEYRRFSLIDRDLGVGGSFKPSANWIVNGGLHRSPASDFLPETVGDLGIARILDNGWIAGIDVRQRRYAADTVNTVGFDIQRYFGRFRAAWQLQNTRLGPASSFVHVGVLDYYAESGSRYGLSASAGDEVEIVAPGQLLEMDISAFALTGRHPLGERLSVLWRVGTHRQGSIYRRNTVGLSVAGTF